MSTRTLTATRKISIVTAITVMIAITGIVAYVQSTPQLVVVDGLFDPWSMKDVARNSQYVLIGTVTDKLVSSVDSEPRLGDKPIVYTDIVVDIENDVAKNFNQDQITVRTIGGKTQDYWTEAFDPKFEISEKVLIFVSKEPDSQYGDHYFVVAAPLGKYKIVDDMAYGPDHKDGISEGEIISEIVKARAIPVN